MSKTITIKGIKFSFFSKCKLTPGTAPAHISDARWFPKKEWQIVSTGKDG